MARIREPEKVMPFWGLLVSPSVDAGDVYKRLAIECFGIHLSRGPIDFDRYTSYYRDQMGDKVGRYWLCGRVMMPPDALTGLKLSANSIEDEYRGAGGIPRPVNLDPGYIAPLIVVAATCKTLPTAIYLRDGVSAYMQLVFRKGRYDTLPWTYRDYAEAAGTFADFRRYYMSILRQSGETGAR